MRRPDRQPKGHTASMTSFRQEQLAVLQGGAAARTVRDVGVPEAQINEFPAFAETVGALFRDASMRR